MTRMDWKRKIGMVWPAWRTKQRKIILLYHSVGNSVWATREQDFNDQINWLFDHCRILSLSELIQSSPSDDIQVALTFDDGYANLYAQVAPIFLQKKINPMLYVNTGWIGDSEKTRRLSDATLGHYPEESFLIWSEVNELHRQGWEIGSHGKNHYDFTQQAENIVKQELFDSKNEIETRLQQTCLHFSYPWGRHSPKLKTIVKETGYHYAVAGHHRSLDSAADALALPRINIAREYSLQDFKAIVKGKWDYLGLIHRVKGM